MLHGSAEETDDPDSDAGGNSGGECLAARDAASPRRDRNGLVLSLRDAHGFIEASSAGRGIRRM